MITTEDYIPFVDIVIEDDVDDVDYNTHEEQDLPLWRFTCYLQDGIVTPELYVADTIDDEYVTRFLSTINTFQDLGNDNFPSPALWCIGFVNCEISDRVPVLFLNSKQILHLQSYVTGLKLGNNQRDNTRESQV
jgi:hypothetical protein